MKWVTVVGVIALVVLASPASALATGAPTDAATGGDPAAGRSPAPGAVSDGAPPVTVASGADDRWHADPVTVTFSATGETAAVAATYVQLDGGAPVATAELVVPAPRDHSGDGVHTLTYWSVDVDGRAEIPQTAAVKIDTRAPLVRDLRLGPNLLRRTRPVHVRFAFSDVCGDARVDYVVHDQYGYLARRGHVSLDEGARAVDIVPRYRNRRAFDPGLYRVTLTLVDQAGNTTTTRSLVFRDYHATRARVTHHVNGAGKRVALTFDDGGPAWVWGRMLDTFKAYRMHGTFFVLGPYVAAAPQMARLTAREGHGIGSHGWTHSEMTRQGYAGVRSELIRSQAPWWRAARATPVGWFRPPYGSYNAATVAAAGSAGYGHFIMWDVDPGDWRGYSASTIAANTLSHVHSGAIIGLHVRTTTMAALPTILRGLRARGYTSVSLPELFRAAGRR